MLPRYQGFCNSDSALGYNTLDFGALVYGTLDHGACDNGTLINYGKDNNGTDEQARISPTSLSRSLLLSQKISESEHKLFAQFTKIGA